MPWMGALPCRSAAGRGDGASTQRMCFRAHVSRLFALNIKSDEIHFTRLSRRDETAARPARSGPSPQPSARAPRRGAPRTRTADDHGRGREIERACRPYVLHKQHSNAYSRAAHPARHMSACACRLPLDAEHKHCSHATRKITSVPPKQGEGCPWVPPGGSPQLTWLRGSSAW